MIECSHDRMEWCTHGGRGAASSWPIRSQTQTKCFRPPSHTQSKPSLLSQPLSSSWFFPEFFISSSWFLFVVFLAYLSSIHSKPVCDFVSYLNEDSGEEDERKSVSVEEDTRKVEREKEKVEKKEDRFALRVGIGKGKTKVEEEDGVSCDVKCSMTIPLAIACNKYSISLTLTCTSRSYKHTPVILSRHSV
jgi:hypothetical protein